MKHPAAFYYTLGPGFGKLKRYESPKGGLAAVTGNLYSDIL